MFFFCSYEVKSSDRFPHRLAGYHFEGGLYVAELASVHRERPGIRVVVYDHSFTDDSAWFRFTFVWPDAATGERRSRAGMQSYRIEGGKLAETWITLLPIGSAWTDAVAQERWTIPLRRP